MQAKRGMNHEHKTSSGALRRFVTPIALVVVALGVGVAAEAAADNATPTQMGLFQF